MRDTRTLDNRQRVHIRAQADRTVGVASPQRGDDAMTADPGDKRHAELSKPRLNEGRCLLFMQRQFRIGVQMTAPFRQRFMQGVVHQPFTFRMSSAH